jgi:hypothetical protein
MILDLYQGGVIFLKMNGMGGNLTKGKNYKWLKQIEDLKN